MRPGAHLRVGAGALSSYDPQMQYMAEMVEAADTWSLISSDLGVAAIGALVTVTGGLIGVGVQSARSHSRWLREHRFEACKDAIACALRSSALALELKDLEADKATGAEVTNAQIEGLRRQVDGVQATMHSAIAALASIGPEALYLGARKLMTLALKEPGENQLERIDEFVAVARKVLNAGRPGRGNWK